MNEKSFVRFFISKTGTVGSAVVKEHVKLICASGYLTVKARRAPKTVAITRGLYKLPAKTENFLFKLYSSKS